MNANQYVVVTGAKNEESYIQSTIDSVTNQTHLPAKWVIFDDGSTDATPQILAAAARKYSWITVLTGPPTTRQSGAAVANAVDQALGEFQTVKHDYLCIVDADLRFGSRYFETLLGHFGNNLKLGIAAGQSYEQHKGGELRRERAEPELTAGVVKAYRIQCFQAIGGLVRRSGWDTIDCYKAMMLGWQTRTFQDEALRIIHLRPQGASHKSVFHGRRQRGKAMHFMGTNPLWMLGSALYHSVDKPYVLGSLGMLAGYSESMLRCVPRIDDKRLLRFVRDRQLRRLSRALLLGR